MKVVVDHNVCEGNGRCSDVAPEIFELRDDDRAYVRVEAIEPSMRAKAELAVSICPRQAIRLINE